jgi:hypothetical protein
MVNDSQRRMTTNPERIREWAETRGVVPVSTQGGEGHAHSFARRDEFEEGQEEATWDEFEETFRNEGLVFVYREDETAEGLGAFDLLERDRAFERVDLGRNEFEDSLRRGETVTSELVETQIIEREIVERDTIESEVVETDLVDRELVDSELLNRDVVEIDFLDDETLEVIVDETRLDTIDETERYTVESRVVDIDIEHDDELERDELETGPELETIQRSLLESDVVRSDVPPDDVIEEDVIQSKRTEGDTVRSELVERRRIEEDIEEQRRFRYVLEAAEMVSTEVLGTKLIDGEIIEGGADEIPTERGTAADAVTNAEATDATAEGGAERAAPNETVAGVSISPDEQGKNVVDERGNEIGIVSAVEEGTAYVDPKPGLTDRLKARLDWGSHGDDEYPLESSQITDVTDNEVVVRSE